MSPEIQFEQQIYISNGLSAIFLGADIVLCFMSIYFLLNGRYNPRRSYFYVCYSLMSTILLSTSIATNFLLGQFMWINHRDVPGGPPAWFAMNVNIWYSTLGSAAVTTLVFMSDALLLYRCYILMGSRRRYIILPGLIMLASTSVGIVSVIIAAKPDQRLTAGDPAVFGSAWISLSATFNGLVTFIICGRILYAQRKLKRVMPAEHMAVYTGVIAILVESALPYTVSGIMLAAVFRNETLSFGFSAPWGALAAIAPQLVILRVAMGSAWSKNTLTDSTISQPIQFNHNRDDTVLSIKPVNEEDEAKKDVES